MKYHYLPKTRDEWCEYMFPRLTLNGRRVHNIIIHQDNKRVAEDWETGETIEIKPTDDVQFCIPVDPRFIPDGNRSYTDVMLPEYVLLGAQNWKDYTDEELYQKYPKRPRSVTK